MIKSLAALALAACAISPAFAQPGVGISIGINQPGVYGRINIGDVPQPALVYAQPVVITPPPVAVQRRPIYLYVPDVQQRDWRRYCGRYNACGQPVYFVQDRWVRERYEHEHPGWNNGKHKGWDKHGRDDRRGPPGHRDDRDDDRGDHGHGRGH
ncbi:hypothetical protein BH11PSE9_BH11PSE9_10260 [soil metagenome]